MAKGTELFAELETRDTGHPHQNITGTDVGAKRALDVNPLGSFSIAQSTVTKRFYNEIIAAADTEQSLVLPADIAGYIIRTRNNGILKLSHTSGESGTNYMTIPARATHTDSNRYASLTIYFQSPTINEVVEIVAWEL